MDFISNFYLMVCRRAFPPMFSIVIWISIVNGEVYWIVRLDFFRPTRWTVMLLVPWNIFGTHCHRSRSFFFQSKNLKKLYSDEGKKTPFQALIEKKWIRVAKKNIVYFTLLCVRNVISTRKKTRLAFETITKWFYSFRQMQNILERKEKNK